MSKPKTSTNTDIPDQILKKLLTASEIRMLKNRWQIVQDLKEGLTIRKIAEKVKVGTDTVVRVSRMVENGQLYKSLGEKNNGKKIKSNTPWIFGKSE